MFATVGQSLTCFLKGNHHMISRWLHGQILLRVLAPQITRAQWAYLPSLGSSFIHSNARVSATHHVMTGTMLGTFILHSKTVIQVLLLFIGKGTEARGDKGDLPKVTQLVSDRSRAQIHLPTPHLSHSQTLPLRGVRRPRHSHIC